MPAIEVLSFQSSPEFAENHLVLKPAYDHVLAAEGALWLYHGLQAKSEGTTAFLIIAWDTYAHHKALMGRPDYTSLTRALVPAKKTPATPLRMLHINLNLNDPDDPDLDPTGPDAEAGALVRLVRAPVTEVVELRVRGAGVGAGTETSGGPDAGVGAGAGEGADTEGAKGRVRLVELLKRLGEKLRASEGCHGAVGGETMEEAGTFVMVVGWDSIEAHVSAVHGADLAEIITELYALAEIDLRHANFEEYVAQA